MFTGLLSYILEYAVYASSGQYNPTTEPPTCVVLTWVVTYVTRQKSSVFGQSNIKKTAWLAWRKLRVAVGFILQQCFASMDFLLISNQQSLSLHRILLGHTKTFRRSR